MIARFSSRRSHLDQTFLNVRLACAGEYERITNRLDKDVLDWFRQQATVQGGGNYQTAINQVLKEYIYSHQPPLEELLRRVVREELEHYKTE